MCLGAIYWARLEKVYYACSRFDAAAAHFDDSFIYDEILVPPSERSIAMHHLNLTNALQPFQLWAEKSDKLVYWQLNIYTHIKFSKNQQVKKTDMGGIFVNYYLLTDWIKSKNNLWLKIDQSNKTVIKTASKASWKPVIHRVIHSFCG